MTSPCSPAGLVREPDALRFPFAVYERGIVSLTYMTDR